MLTRRTMLAATAGAASLGLPHPADAETKVAVYYADGCGACDGWVAHMRANGFQPRAFQMASEQLETLKRRFGVTDTLASSHTAVVGPYVIEGHVPAEDVRRLIASGRDVVGLAAPGLVPGLASDRPDVLVLLRDGTTELFARH